MRKIIIFSFLLLGFHSCISTSEFQVSKVGEEPSKTVERTVYVLPRTVLEVTVNYEKESRIPGIYRKYTDRLFGIEGYITEPSVSYKITNVKVKPISEPDPQQYFSINLLRGSFDSRNYLRLNQSGFIVDPSMMIINGNYLRLNQSGFIVDPSMMIINDSKFSKDNDLLEPPYFTDFSIKGNLKEVTDTLFKTIIRDTSYVKIPIVRKQQEAKTIDQKAEEAANLIYRIRRRRFRLLEGSLDVFPEGDALNISLRELNQLEKEYLELFLGKTVKQGFTRSFMIVPKESSVNQVFEIAKFSQQVGLLEKESSNGEKLSLQINNLGTLNALKNSAISSKLYTKNNLYYRLPEVSEVIVSLNKDMLFESRMSIYQTGVLLSLPLIK